MGITSKNSNLTKAKAAKNDEFYTQYSDIEAELSHYEVRHFADRVVYLPCDDWHFSQFVKYFENNFTRLQLKALVATGINFYGAGYYYKKTSEGIITGELQGNGDFRSDACRQLMKEADIIVTNPPFSLFREFVAQIMEFRKKFLIIGNQNIFSYKEVFEYIRDNKLWLGNLNIGSSMLFHVTSDFEQEIRDTKKKGTGWRETPQGFRARVPAVWITNLDLRKRHEECRLTCIYTSEKYPKYYNFDAIEVSKLPEIPCDYFGIMGVPISFPNVYNPDQFEIIGLGISTLGLEAGVQPYKPEHKEYRRKVQGKGAADGDLYMLDEEGHPVVPYARILIKRKTIPVEAEFLQSFVDGVERRSC